MDKQTRQGIAEALELILEWLPYPDDDKPVKQAYVCWALNDLEHDHADAAIAYIRSTLSGSLTLGTWLRKQGFDIEACPNRIHRHRVEWVKFLIHELRK